MKYTTEIEINLPVEKVIELFDNSDNLSKWQPELISFKHLSGEPGQVGEKSKLRYRMGKREIEMMETTDPIPANATLTDYIVRIQVCVPGLLESNSKQYPNGNYKPIGLLQRHG